MCRSIGSPATVDMKMICRANLPPLVALGALVDTVCARWLERVAAELR